MAPRLNRGEYWLLTNASEHGLPLRLVGMREGPPWSPTTLQEAMNREGHGMDLPTLADTLHRLSRRRWIEFAPPMTACRTAETLVLDRQGIRRELATRGRFDEGPSYALTPLGGQVWESFAQPDWSRYIEDSCAYWIDDEEPDGGDDWSCREVTTMHRRTLERYMEAVRNEHQIRPGSESLQTRDDWTYCYWRPPCNGLLWRFVARQVDRIRPPSTQWFQERWCEWR